MEAKSNCPGNIGVGIQEPVTPATRKAQPFEFRLPNPVCLSGYGKTLKPLLYQRHFIGKVCLVFHAELAQRTHPLGEI